MNGYDPNNKNAWDALCREDSGAEKALGGYRDAMLREQEELLGTVEQGRKKASQAKR